MLRRGDWWSSGIKGLFRSCIRHQVQVCLRRDGLSGNVVTRVEIWYRGRQVDVSTWVTIPSSRGLHERLMLANIINLCRFACDLCSTGTVCSNSIIAHRCFSSPHLQLNLGSIALMRCGRMSTTCSSESLLCDRWILNFMLLYMLRTEISLVKPSDLTTLRWLAGWAVRMFTCDLRHEAMFGGTTLSAAVPRCV